jgi:hypothetical protein
MTRKKTIREGVYQGKYNFDIWIRRHADDRLTELNVLATNVTQGEFNRFYRLLNKASVADQTQFCLDWTADQTGLNPRICLISNPSTSLQQAVVSKFPHTIRYIIENRKLIKVEKDKYSSSRYADVYFRYAHVRGPIEPRESVQLAAVSADGRVIGYLQRPSEAVQLAAIKQNARAFEYLMNNRIKISPKVMVHLAGSLEEKDITRRIIDIARHLLTEQAQLDLVKEDGMNIANICKLKITPSKEVQFAAVSQNPDSIDYIPDPDEDIKTLADFIKSHGTGTTDSLNINKQEINEWFGSGKDNYVPGHNCEYFHDDCTKREQLDMLRRDGMWIGCYKYPSEKLQKIAVEQNGLAIEYIRNPMPLIQLAAVKQNTKAIAKIEKPHPKVLSAVLSKDPWVLRELSRDIRDNLSIEDQLVAVKQDGRVVVYLGDKASNQALEAAVASDPDAIMWIIRHETASVNERLLEIAFKHHRDITAFLELGMTLTEKMQMFVVENNGLNIEHLYKKGITPSLEVKKAAIMQNPESIKCIPETDTDYSILVMLAEFTKSHTA